MFGFKLTKEDLLAIILLINKSNTVNIIDSEDLIKYKQLVPGVISILLIQCFGEHTADLIWKYATESNQNQFNSIDELYEYLQDPYTKLVTNKALSLKELIALYPEYSMLSKFQEYINEEFKNN